MRRRRLRRILTASSSTSATSGPPTSERRWNGWASSGAAWALTGTGVATGNVFQVAALIAEAEAVALVNWGRMYAKRPADGRRIYRTPLRIVPASPATSTSEPACSQTAWSPTLQSEGKVTSCQPAPS